MSSTVARLGSNDLVSPFVVGEGVLRHLQPRAKDSVQLIFHLGAKVRPDQKAFRIADPKGLVKWLGRDRAMVTLGSGRSIPANRAALEAIVSAWIGHV